MRRNAIRVLIILATISILGVVAVQVYWFKKAFNTEEEQFNRDVNTALFNVANQFFEISETAVPSNNPIQQLNTNYYVVMINRDIDANLLEYLLRAEFEKRNITVDFEYGIYDCSSDKMVYGNYVSFDEKASASETSILPKWENQSYYFGVQFPDKTSIIKERMGIWVFSSTVLLIVVIFFSYAMFVILKQRRLSEVQKDFINNMTHEFKTPISTIALSAEVLKSPGIAKQPERLINYATIIENENQRLKNQVERVLQMASVDKSGMALKKENLSLHGIVHEALKAMRHRLEENNTKMELALKAENDLISADRLHLVNVMYNLIDNALKYRKEDPAININTQNYNNHINIEIIDNGIGIDKANLKKIFDKFFRVPTGNIHDVKGFGLGLNYVRLVVLAHGGSVSVFSEAGEGTKFLISLRNA